MADESKQPSVRGDLATAVERAAGEESKAASVQSDSIEGAPKAASKRGRRSLPNATELRFLRVSGRPEVARVQLLLCNISDRAIFWKLKASEAHISALPSGSGHLAARASARCVLSWHRAPGVAEWTAAAPPKLLLVTRFLNARGEHTDDVTSTRLLARVAAGGSCAPNRPPVEQLLLDAITPAAAADGPGADEMSIRKALSPEKTDEPPAAPPTAFFVALSPPQLWLLLLAVAVLLLALYNAAR
ncbi:hypothetical protein M3Y99_01116400 [Aphelenchoides fujianensis]|nr:hypothetical protein M3Y99_01116400 [Aphelenchoides fujianensis]